MRAQFGVPWVRVARGPVSRLTELWLCMSGTCSRSLGAVRSAGECGSAAVGRRKDLGVPEDRGWKGARSLCPATVPLTPSASLNGTCNRQ